MSKLTKLVLHPIRFFNDAAAKRRMSSAPNSQPPVSEIGSGPGTVTAAVRGTGYDLSRANLVQSTKLMLHTGEGQPGRAHLRMWIPRFIDSGVPFIVLVRSAELFKWASSEYPWLSVAYVTTPMQVEALIGRLPYLQAIFYPSNTGNNIHLLRFNEPRHIFIGHGDSDKSGSAHKFFRAYDEIWVAGQAHIDRFVNAGFQTAHMKFVKVGRPNLRSVLKTADLPWAARFKGLSVLYLPTWEGVYEEQNYSSLPLSSDLLTSLQRKFKAHTMVKLHPQTGQRDKSLANAEAQITSTVGSAARVEDRTIPVEDLIIKANLYICDISAVVTECLSVDAPVFIYKPDNREIRIASSAMPFEEFAYTFSSTEELLQKIEKVLGGNDELAENRHRAVDYFVGRKETVEDEFGRQLKALGKLPRRMRQPPGAELG